MSCNRTVCRIIMAMLAFGMMLLASCRGGGGSNGMALLALMVLGSADDPPASLDIPTGVAASSNATDGVTVTWNAVPRARFYQVFRSDTESGAYSPLGENNVASYNDASPIPGQSYYYRIVAGWRSIKTPSLEVMSGQSLSDEGHAILTAPTGVTATTDSASPVTVSWSAVSHADTYRVLRSTTAGGTYAEIATGISGGEHQDGTAVAGTKYYYRVIAYSAQGIAGRQSDAVAGYRCTPSPGNFSASDGNYYTYVKLAWDAAASTTGYELYRDGTLIGTTAGTAYNDSGAASGTVHQYRVVALHTNGGKSLPAQDNGNRRSLSATISCPVSWSANREKAVNSTNGGYRVYYSTSHIPATGFEGIAHANVPYSAGSWAPTSTTLSLGPGAGTWYIRVVAYSGLNGGSAGRSSAETSVIIY